MRWTAADMPDQAGRRAVVTGANSGLGFHVATELARKGAHVVLAARDEQRGAADGAAAGLAEVAAGRVRHGTGRRRRTNCCAKTPGISRASARSTRLMA